MLLFFDQVPECPTTKITGQKNINSGVRKSIIWKWSIVSGLKQSSYHCSTREFISAHKVHQLFNLLGKLGDWTNIFRLLCPLSFFIKIYGVYMYTCIFYLISSNWVFKIIVLIEKQGILYSIHRYKSSFNLSLKYS